MNFCMKNSWLSFIILLFCIDQVSMAATRGSSFEGLSPLYNKFCVPNPATCTSLDTLRRTIERLEKESVMPGRIAEEQIDKDSQSFSQENIDPDVFVQRVVKRSLSLKDKDDALVVIRSLEDRIQQLEPQQEQSDVAQALGSARSSLPLSSVTAWFKDWLKKK